jgi:hypothetical protein
MSAARRGSRLFLAALGIVAFTLAQAAGEDPGFMPKGGRALLLDLLGAAPDQTELRAIVTARRSEAEWRDFVAARGKALTEREAATLAAYLAVNMPLPGGAGLPRDGRDLAWHECQSCHSLFSGYLTHRRSAQAWRNMFLSPFHREMKMSAQEREEFARYSELNMPMKFEDVPEELRF